ncbi:MAG: hypothetical protein NZ899_04640 [Thermoguttaceae bacterium]|nr:hypothetical protein [Thermoguttaceae bacterium]MDW8077874.1 hypothetical protein [Thermoguttaceae bacterium]
MALLVGVDEAGYGPRIGPLVLALTAWQLPRESQTRDPHILETLLRAVVRRDGEAQGTPEKVCIDDSKKIYRSPRDLPKLEIAALSLLQLAGFAGKCLQELLPFVDQGLDPRWKELPWLKEGVCLLPRSISPQSLESAKIAIRQQLTAHRVQLVACRAKILFEPIFNEYIRLLGNKAALAAEVVVELLTQVLIPPKDEAVVLIDRQGGRIYYGQLVGRIAQMLPAAELQVVNESPERSQYRIITSLGNWDFGFWKKAEQFLPVAAASMIAKYIRELVLICFNSFWCHRVPGLRPTAGYPGDAKRFKTAIAASQEALQIPDDWLWRIK